MLMSPWDSSETRLEDTVQIRVISFLLGSFRETRNR